MNTRNLKELLVAGCGVALIAASSAAVGQDMAGATAQLRGTDGGAVGTVGLSQGPHGLHLVADLNGLPAGTHAFHLHAVGACSPEFKAAGGHFNPTGKAHGFLSDAGPHAGDLPNIHVPDGGALQFELFLAGLSLAGGASPLFDEDGTAVVIHEGVDDYTSDPAGAAGNRIACGVLEPQ